MIFIHRGLSERVQHSRITFLVRLLVVGLESVAREERQVALLADVGHENILASFDLTDTIEVKLTFVHHTRSHVVLILQE